LTAAITAAHQAQINAKPAQIVLLDTREKIGAKILMSGGTRCNVTNREVKPSDFGGGSSHFIRHILKAFSPEATIEFFKKIGVELVLEPSGKFFPKTNSAQTVLDALLHETKQLGVSLKTGVRVTKLTKENNLFYLENADHTFNLSSHAVILTTGGLSYPATGSDGTGYSLAKGFGHTLIATYPALTPLLTGERDWQRLSGIALEVALSFFKNDKKIREYQDSFLFTHFGFSGPAALDISRHWAASDPKDKPQIVANFLPGQSALSVKEHFQIIQTKNQNRLIRNILTEDLKLPGRFVEVILRKAKIKPDQTIGKCPNEERQVLSRLLFHYPLEVRGVYGYQKAEVTAGGIDLSEVKFQTMASKLTDGLYFAGEILDVDGRIGGFNFQWAWSTGTVAGRSAVNSLK